MFNINIELNRPMEDNFNTEFDLDDAFSSEDDGVSLSNITINRNTVDTSAVQSRLSESKLSQMEEKLNSLMGSLESSKKSHYLDAVLQKYENVDPVFKQMLIDMNIASNEFTKEHLKEIHKYFEQLKQDVEVVKAEQKNLNDYASSIHTDITTHRLVKKYLERGFKKNTIKEEHVEKALEEHMKRVNKDEAYHLRLQSIWNTPGMDTTGKNRLTGQLILENFKEVASKAKGKKADELPTAKKTLEVDANVEKSQKKLDKLQAEQASEPTLTVEKDPDLVNKLRNKIRKL